MRDWSIEGELRQSAVEWKEKNWREVVKDRVG